MADVGEALQEPTGIVSAMLVNNETGVIQDVPAIAEKARAAKAWMHTDAVQALGKIPVDFAALGVHALTVSAHKLYGPKGAAALVIDKRLQLKPIIHGGGHEQGLRSGTENVPAIVGFGAACALAAGRMPALAQRLEGLRARFEQGLEGMGAVIFGDRAPRISNTTYFAFKGILGETLVIELDKAGYAVAPGAACSSANPEPSATLLAMGVDPELAAGAVRFSLGAANTPPQIEAFLKALESVVTRLRSLTAMAV
jgi:cysteine desulfurase